jgi:outer membrane protein
MIRDDGPDGARARGGPFKFFGAILVFSFLFLAQTDCISLKDLTSRTSPSPGETWKPTREEKRPAVESPPVTIPPDLLQTRESWSLANLIDIGLRNNLQTRSAWQSARAAAAAVGTAESSLYPTVSGTVTGAKTRGTFGNIFSYNYSSLDLAANLNYLLFDFGGRIAEIERVRRALEAANWMHNSAIQDVILNIQQAYYQYISTVALLDARKASLKEAQANLDAGNTRMEVGVATITEVLQLKTAVSSAQLDHVSTQGLIQTLKGTLADSIGLPANVDFEVADALPEELPLEKVSGGVDSFIEEAQAARPDLAAARSRVLAADAAIKSARAQRLPSLAANGSVGRNYYLHSSNPSNNLAFSLSLNIPIFSGFSLRYQQLQAEVNAEEARVQMKQLEQSIILEVWTSYYNLESAKQRIETAQTLYESAQQSHRVALLSYKDGVATILDLLAAQSSLVSGRVQLLQAKTDWLLSLAQFAHATGSIKIPEKAQNKDALDEGKHEDSR